MTGALSITGCRWRGLGPTPATGQRFRLAAAIFVAVDLAAEQRAARGAEHRAEELVAIARDLVAGEAADGAADQQAGRAIVLLAAITTVAAAPDAGVRIDPLVARGVITAILLAIEIRAFVDLAIALCRDCVRQTGISRILLKKSPGGLRRVGCGREANGLPTVIRRWRGAGSGRSLPFSGGFGLRRRGGTRHGHHWDRAGASGPVSGCA